MFNDMRMPPAMSRVRARGLLSGGFDLEGGLASMIVEDGERIARAILHDHGTLPGLGAAGVPGSTPVTPVTRVPQG
jgi:hypothetical protein